MCPPRMVAAEVPDRGRMFYLVDDTLDFIPEVKEFLDWKAATKRAPATVKAYCSRLLWYYRFLAQRELNLLEATAADLTEFVIWLCNPHRDAGKVKVIHEPSPLQATSVTSFCKQWEHCTTSWCTVESSRSLQYALWMCPEENG